VPYKFPQKGPHLTLGFHRYALTGGFTSLSEEGLEDVLAWAGTPEVSPEKAPERVPSPASETRIAERPAASGHRTARPVVNDEVLEKRSAGQHAMGKARKQIVLWTIAETLTQAVGWKAAHKNARDKALDAQRTWLKGGRAEKQVGAELERLREHGFYIFHDVQLPDVGNVDHVALGPRGFFGIETKSQSGGVRARGNQLLLNGRPPGKDFVSQTWSGCFRLKDILDAEVSPLLCFTEAFVEGRVFVRGVRVLPLRWLVEEILRGEVMHDSLTVAKAVNALGAATGCYPSSVPRAKS
ncbi:MAG TPA: nuclease-related domain-containing protein, partial [Rubrobacteraceae bacterium]|nr:nuclease-related domain-containing protein [Rubrobacteraceae bacterium]